MDFNSYIVSKTKNTKTTHLILPPPPYSSKGFELFGKLKIKKFKAFTLAEVLITLTIVGIIAAMTIPNLLIEIEKKEIEAGVAAAYKILDTAVGQAEIEHGSVENWDYNPNNLCSQWSNQNATLFAETYLIPYLKVAYICNGAKKPCFKGTAQYNTYAGSSGDKVSNYLDPTLGYNFCLENGMCMSVSCKDAYPGPMYVTVDINGPGRGGSILGRDVFRYGIGVPSNKLGRRIRVNPGQSSIFDVSRQNLLKANNYIWGVSNLQCTPTYMQSGAQHSGCGGGPNCAGVIALSGWKVPSDYPLKKMAKKMLNP